MRARADGERVMQIHRGEEGREFVLADADLQRWAAPGVLRQTYHVQACIGLSLVPGVQRGRKQHRISP
jgi:hypothetical protein